MMSKTVLTTKTLLITGASRGIGAAAAVLAAQNGWQIAVNYAHNVAAANAVVEQIIANGGKAKAFQADVSVEADILGLFAEVNAYFGSLHGLVNNAGVVDITAKLVDMSWQRIERQLRTNVLGSMICAREAVKQMATSNGGAGGSIVNLSSAAARLGSPNQYLDYAASKGAIDTFTIGLAKEVAAEGIRVNAVRPGVIDTEIHASGGLPNRATDLAPSVPMQRAGTAMEVAQAIVFLLSDAASYTTGSILDVAGGR